MRFLERRIQTMPTAPLDSVEIRPRKVPGVTDNDEEKIPKSRGMHALDLVEIRPVAQNIERGYISAGEAQERSGREWENPYI